MVCITWHESLVSTPPLFLTASSEVWARTLLILKVGAGGCAGAATLTLLKAASEAHPRHASKTRLKGRNSTTKRKGRISLTCRHQLAMIGRKNAAAWRIVKRNRLVLRSSQTQVVHASCKRPAAILMLRRFVNLETGILSLECVCGSFTANPMERFAES